MFLQFRIFVIFIIDQLLNLMSDTTERTDTMEHNQPADMQEGNNAVGHAKSRQIKGMLVEEIREFLTEIGQPAYRAGQIFNWMYNHAVMDFDEMLNLPKTLRDYLKANCSIQSLHLAELQSSGATGTKKFLFTTGDGRSIESVLIPDGDRATLCVSTQAGCPLDCKFCATGLMGYKRNLTTGEIVDQYLIAANEFGKEKITNIVYMGMGEPLLNYSATVRSLSIFTDELTKGLSRNRITVSTAGITPRITDLAESGIRVKLALSLHSCFDDVRTTIMPINKKYPIKETLEAVKYFSAQTNTRITFEYTMLKGINDRPEDIKALVKLCRTIPSKVNLIPFNSIAHMSPGGISAELRPTPGREIELFAAALRLNNITVLLRDTQGSDISAACGQLAITIQN